MAESPAPREADDAPGSRWWSGSWSVGLGAGLGLFLVLVVANLDLLRSRIVEEGDFAANSILIDRAIHGRLLVGNYSRVGFNHPGPALLQVQAFGQVVFHRWLGVVPTPYDGQFLGILVLNAVCAGLAAAMVHRWSRSVAAALAVPAVVLLLDRWVPTALASTWMPHLYIAPFLLFCVATASVTAGSWRDLWAMVAGGGLLVHGHVSFVMFVGATTLVVAVWLAWSWRRDRAGWVRPRRRDLGWAAVVAAVFAAPIVANLVLHWPGELRKYAHFASTKPNFQPRGAGDVARWVGRYWSMGGPVTVALVVVAGLVAVVVVPRLEARWRRFLVAVAAVVVLETVLVAVYGFRGVDDLSEQYVAYFSMILPVLVIWMGVAALVTAPPVVGSPTWRSATVPLVAVVAVVTMLVGTTSNDYRGLVGAASYRSALGRGGVRLGFGLAAWPPAVGMLEQARRDGVGVCVVDPALAFLVTAAEICSPKDTRPILLVSHAADRPPGRVVAQVGDIVLTRI